MMLDHIQHVTSNLDPSQAVLDLSVGRLAEIISGQLSLGCMPSVDGELQQVGRIVTDSRLIRPGDLFWALPGPTCNGEHYAEDAILRGAQGTVVAQRAIEPWGGRFSIRVRNSVHALSDLACWMRRQFCGTAIAVAGGPGKSTTATTLHQLLRDSRHGSCDINLSPDVISFALSMLQWRCQNDYAIVEFPADHPEQIAEISALCVPRIVAITSPQKSTHHSSFRDREAFADNFNGLLDSVPDDAVVIMCGDESRLRSMARRRSTRILWIGRSSDCDVVASDVRYRDGHLALRVDGQRLAFPLWGRHHLPNILIAVAVGRMLGVTLLDLQRAADSIQPLENRCQVTSVAGIRWIDDTHNATPLSIRAALGLLAETSTRGRRRVVCGDLDVNVETAEVQHRQLGQTIVTSGCADQLICCGQYAAVTAEAARHAGMPTACLAVCQSTLEATDLLDRALQKDDVVLVSGRRSQQWHQWLQLRFACPTPEAA